MLLIIKINLNIELVLKSFILKSRKKYLFFIGNEKDESTEV